MENKRIMAYQAIFIPRSTTSSYLSYILKQPASFPFIGDSWLKKCRRRRLAQTILFGNTYLVAFVIEQHHWFKRKRARPRVVDLRILFISPFPVALLPLRQHKRERTAVYNQSSRHLNKWLKLVYFFLKIGRASCRERV